MLDDHRPEDVREQRVVQRGAARSADDGDCGGDGAARGADHHAPGG
jgi:hypothetical protein